MDRISQPTVSIGVCRIMSLFFANNMGGWVSILAALVRSKELVVIERLNCLSVTVDTGGREVWVFFMSLFKDRIKLIATNR